MTNHIQAVELCLNIHTCTYICTLQNKMHKSCSILDFSIFEVKKNKICSDSDQSSHALLFVGSWVGAVVRALAFHQCVPGSIP